MFGCEPADLDLAEIDWLLVTNYQVPRQSMSAVYVTGEKNEQTSSYRKTVIQWHKRPYYRD